MKLTEAVELLNSKQKSIPELAEDLGVSQIFIKNVLKENFYAYNRSEDMRYYAGEGKPNDIDLQTEFIEWESKKRKVSKEQTDKKEKKIINKSEKNQKKIINESENKQEKNEQKDEQNIFTEEEIKCLKDFAERRIKARNELDLKYEVSMLPSKQINKKSSYDISKKTYDEFDEYHKKYGNVYRMSKNDMLEVALIRFMREFR